jgi:hypothetical protein
MNDLWGSAKHCQHRSEQSLADIYDATPWQFFLTF